MLKLHIGFNGNVGHFDKKCTTFQKGFCECKLKLKTQTLSETVILQHLTRDSHNTNPSWHHSDFTNVGDSGRQTLALSKNLWWTSSHVQQESVPNTYWLTSPNGQYLWFGLVGNTRYYKMYWIWFIFTSPNE